MIFDKSILNVVLVLSNTLPCWAFTYWIDEGSCGEGVLDNKVMTETFQMATRSYERLNNPRDTDMQLAYSTVFNTDMNNAVALTRVNSITGGIKDWIPATGINAQQTSNIRIYCDNDEQGQPGNRWQLVPDVQGDPTPNSNLPADQQSWYDVENMITRAVGPVNVGNSRTCLADDPLGVTYCDAYANIPGQTSLRCTITVCDVQLVEDDLPLGKQTLSDIASQYDLAGISDVNLLHGFVSLTLLHEFTHFTVYNNNDDGGYPWATIIARPWPTTIWNGENYNFLGLLAQLGDRYFRLTSPDPPPSAGKLE